MKDILHRIILIAKVLRIPSDSRIAREKLQQVHEDIVQDDERGIPFLIRFNQYFDISGIHDTEYQHYLQQSMNGTEHPKMRISTADDFAEEAEKKADALSRELTREEVEELFLARDAVLVNKASRKEIDEGHLPHDTHDKIYRPHRPRAAPAARKTRTTAQGASVSSAMEQAELDEIKADGKRSGVKAAERAAKQAVAAALGIEFTDEAPEEAADMEHHAAASVNATCAVDFAASAEWKEMKQWRTKVDADNAGTKKTMTKLAEAQSKMAGDFATGRAENQSNFDALTAVLTNMQKTMAGGQQAQQQTILKGPCRQCKVQGHGKNSCPITDDDEARNMRFAWYGEQQSQPRSALTELLTCALQPQTRTRSAMKTTLQLTLDATENTHTGEVHWTIDIKHDEAPLQEPQHQPAPSTTGTEQAKMSVTAQETTSTGMRDTQAGILSQATIRSAIPHSASEPPANTDPESKISNENKSTHTPHTHTLVWGGPSISGFDSPAHQHSGCARCETTCSSGTCSAHNTGVNISKGPHQTSENIFCL